MEKRASIRQVTNDRFLGLVNVAIVQSRPEFGRQDQLRPLVLNGRDALQDALT